MDVPRGKEVARRRTVRRIIYISVGLLALGGVGIALARLKPAAPSVEWSTLWPDTVRRGEMICQVRGLGTLVPEDVNWIQAQFDGHVDKIMKQPGENVSASDVILVLSNPDMELASDNAEWQLKAAEATYRDLKVRLETQQLAQKSVTEQMHSDYQQAALTADRDEQLTKLGLKSELETKLSVAKAAELKNSWELSKQQLDISGQSIEAQLAAQQVQVEQLRAAWELKKKQVQQLTIRAGVNGVLTQLGTSDKLLEVGQRVAPGAILAKVVQPSKLLARLKIPETQAKDVAPGQLASIDTRNGIVDGHVSRIDPAVTNGTVDVDVRLDGKLPDGARPDLSGRDGGIPASERCSVHGPAGDRAGESEDWLVQS